ncbi:MAG: hypothetical protein ACLQU1_03485 [Bryobacteraceae bacterium]
MNTRNYQSSLLARISSGISAHAAHLQRLDLARLGRGVAAACQFQDMLADLKQQIARKAALRAQGSFAIENLELQSLAA